jgi:hypothetical protein
MPMPDRLYRAYKAGGAAALTSKKRGRPSSRRLSDALRAEAAGLVREKYGDFGPTLACEKLAEVHGVGVSVETIRQWMIGDGIWPTRSRRRSPAHQPRSRRPCVGELAQIDGCNHEWFEARGPRRDPATEASAAPRHATASRHRPRPSGSSSSRRTLSGPRAEIVMRGSGPP